MKDAAVATVMVPVPVAAHTPDGRAENRGSTPTVGLSAPLSVEGVLDQGKPSRDLTRSASTKYCW